MADAPKGKGRGAAILEAVARARATQQEGQISTCGRGIGPLESEGGDARPGMREEISAKAKPRGRGRGALIQKLHELRVGGVPSQSIVESTAPTITTPKRMLDDDEQEESAHPVCKFAGECGDPINITANYIRLAIDKDRGVFEYEVDFSIPVDSKPMRRTLLNLHLDKLGGIKSFDGGHCLYLPIKLPDEVTQIECTHPGNDSPMVMVVKYKKQKRMRECLHLFNTLFKKIMRTLLMYQFNRNYFDLKSAMFIPQYKLEVLPGFAVTCDEFEGGLMLCLDAQHRVLRTQTVHDLMIDLKHVARTKFKEETCKMILGSSVLTKYNQKNYIVDEIMWDATPKDTFKTTSGQEISYMEYYKEQHRLTIKDPNQPLLLHKKKLRNDSAERLICLIPELCYLTGLTDEMRADFKIMQAVSHHTKLSPTQRMKSLQIYINRVNNNDEAKKILLDWGLRLASATIDLNARVLSNEKIIFGRQSETFVGPKMDWATDLCRNCVYQPVDLLSWAVIFVSKDKNCAINFIETMLRVGPPMGCKIKQPRTCVIPNDRTTTVLQELTSVIHPELQCVVVICPTQRQDLYNGIKKICCVQSPIASQVILARTLSKENRLRTITQKIALQIVCKLGGSLWSLHIPARRWMVCGIDVYHSGGGRENFSWYGFVATTNSNFTKYYSVGVKATKEIGQALRTCFTNALMKYYELNGDYPTQVVVFRDGVGDGQLNMCKDFEIAPIEAAFRDMNLGADLCFIVVQKRIGARLFMRRNATLENPLAGTLVDHTITKRAQFDFYLVSQHVNQGTVTPTHYICLHNTSNLKPDIVQKLSYKMCHLYYNWCGTIRVPAPCQYAHKLAYLIGDSIKHPPDNKLDTRLYYL